VDGTDATKEGFGRQGDGSFCGRARIPILWPQQIITHTSVKGCPADGMDMFDGKAPLGLWLQFFDGQQFDHIMILTLSDCKVLKNSRMKTPSNLVFIEFLKLGRSMIAEH